MQAGMLLRSLAGVLVACLALQAATAAVHPDVMAFLRPQVSLPDDEGLQLGPAGRRLQQTFDSPDLPFTFDGFGFGAGGWFPGGGAFGGFATNVYNIVFRDILNAGLNEYVARVLPNDIGDPLNFIPADITKRFSLGNDVVSVFGYDWLDRYIGQYLTEPSAALGKMVNAGCVGPTYSLKVDGGSCEIMKDGSVQCSQPAIKITRTPLTCNLPYRKAASLEGKSWQYKATFGKERRGSIGLPVGTYNWGAAVNITSPYVGYSAQLQRLANDFGVQQWYQFLAQWALNELLRIQAALVSGAVDSKIYTQRAADAAAAAGTPRSAGGGSDIQDSLVQVRDAANRLMSKIAARMGISEKALTAGLNAAGIPVPPGNNGTAISAQQQQQQQKQQGATVSAPSPSDTVDQGTIIPQAGSVADVLNQLEQGAAPDSLSQVNAVDQAEGDADLLANLDAGLQQDSSPKPKAQPRKQAPKAGAQQGNTAGMP